MRWFLALLLLAPCATAQLTAKPETWTSLEGHYIADADHNDALMMYLLSRGAVNQARAAGKRFDAVLPLVELAGNLLAANNLNAAYRMWGRALAVYKGRTPGDWLEAASSLQFQLDRRIAQPGAVIHPRLSPTFVLDRPLRDALSIRITLLDPAGKPVYAPKLDKLDTLEAREFSLPTAGLTPGDYAVQYELIDNDSHVLVSAARDLILDPKLPDRIRSLRAQSEKLSLAGVAAKGPLHALAVETVEFVAAQYDAALRAPLAGYVQNLSPLTATLAGFSKPYYSTDSIVPARDLPLAVELAEGLLAGASPLAARKGDLRL
ncbi:MAG: hypothetical protein HZB13_16310, partial [Acidobacteria bacterium]|nr:hypothetical protein [Acidobacteriota bacterium]